MDTETKKLVKDSIKHWERMLQWAEKQDPNSGVSQHTMYNNINEAWFSSDCPLCGKYVIDGCVNCPLEVLETQCNFTCSDWHQVDRSRTWREWTENAKVMIKTLQQILTEIGMED